MNSTFLSKYKILDKIGEGSFSDVLKCQDRRTCKQYAAKRLKKVFKNAYDVVNCAEIVATNKLVRHPNIVYMLEFHYDPVFGRVIFVFELMNMSMYDFIKSRKRRIPESKVRNYLYQILKGLDHLHSHGLFHRDVKPENILVKLRNSVYNTTYRTQGELIKLADLGSVRETHSKPPYTEYISTRWYRSPECLLTIGYYGPKMDIWATGCVFYEMLLLKPLFPGTDEIDQLAKIHRIIGAPNEKTLDKFRKRSRNYVQFAKQKGVGLKSVSANIGEDSISILELMIQYDPDLRTNVHRLLDHRFFGTLREEDIFYKNRHPANDFTKNLQTNKGDRHNTIAVSNYVPAINKYKSTQRSSEEGCNKKFYSSSPASRTTGDLLDCGPYSKMQNYKLRSGRAPLVGQKQMESWGVNPKMLNPKGFKKDDCRLQCQRTKITCKKPNNCSKTTSDLPQFDKDISNGIKNKRFQSKSFVLTRNSPDIKVKLADRVVKNSGQIKYKNNNCYIKGSSCVLNKCFV